MIKTIHHTAIICSDYQRSKAFYTDVVGLRVLAEHFRQDRKSYKLDLGIGEQYVIELFSFPDPPKRLSRPEACGLRHIAFAVSNIESSVSDLIKKGVACEPIRTDEYTGRRFTFFADPDDLPIELYEDYRRRACDVAFFPNAWTRVELISTMIARQAKSATNGSAQ